MAEHSIKLSNRRNMELTGINNVNNFDEEKIILESELGHIYIIGQDLHIGTLNLEQGRVALEGNIDIIEYKAPGTDIKAKGKSIINRLLK